MRSGMVLSRVSLSLLETTAGGATQVPLLSLSLLSPGLILSGNLLIHYPLTMSISLCGPINMCVCVCSLSHFWIKFVITSCTLYMSVFSMPVCVQEPTVKLVYPMPISACLTFYNVFGKGITCVLTQLDSSQICFHSFTLFIHSTSEEFKAPCNC